MALHLLHPSTRRRLDDADPHWTRKALARALATVLAAVALILFAVAIALTNQNFDNTSGPGDWSDGLALAPAALALLTNALVLALVLRRPDPPHPAVPLLADFLVWALCVPALIFGTAGGLFWYWTPATANARGGDVDCGFFFNAWAEACEPVAYTIGRVEIAGLAVVFAIFVLHVALFAFDCVDLHRRRVERRMGERVEKGSFEVRYGKDMELSSL